MSRLESEKQRNGFRHSVRKVIHGLENVVEVFGAYMMAIMVGIVIYQVFGRYVLHKTPAWSEEVALLFMTAYGFLSIATGFGRKSHLSVTLLFDKLPQPIRKVLDLLNDIIIILFGIFLFYEGYKFTTLTWSSILPATGWPNGLQYLIVPVTGILIVIYGLYWLFIGEEEGS
ncbi:TRAP transporter small permease [Desulfosporosinus sp. SYSU MS00001]|uniref:TRAP transporter small permease n=1 Tax=Desulfosporosinus sp. SYSU MS00001 TaxID=3416284 RepID=UPI003CE6A640